MSGKCWGVGFDFQCVIQEFSLFPQLCYSAKLMSWASIGSGLLMRDVVLGVTGKGGGYSWHS